MLKILLEVLLFIKSVSLILVWIFYLYKKIFNLVGVGSAYYWSTLQMTLWMKIASPVTKPLNSGKKYTRSLLLSGLGSFAAHNRLPSNFSPLDSHKNSSDDDLIPSVQ